MIVITRHTAFVDHCRNIGLIDDNPTVVAHASPDVMVDQDVITSGLPLHLAALCRTVTTVPLNLPAELRGVELTVEQVAAYAEEPQTFSVTLL